MAAAVGVFVLAEWHVAGFRQAMGWLGPRMAFLLYVLAAVVAVGSVFRSRKSRSETVETRAERPSPPSTASPPSTTPGGDRFRFLALPAAMAGSILAFLVALFGTWASGARPTEKVAGTTIAGFIPYSDGTLWFGGAERLLFNGALDDYTSKRPLNGAIVAVQLALTNLDLRMALVLQAVLLGVACCLLARVVARDLGFPVAVALFTGIFGFVSVFVATTYTESLGVATGALAAAALWVALRDRDAWMFAAGLFVLTIAVAVRPGAVAVLLVVPVWFAWSKRSWSVLGLGVSAVVLAVGLDVAASSITGGNPANLNSNSMFMVYGLAVGYPGWNEVPDSWGRVFEDHPEIVDLADAPRAVAVRKLALEAVRDHPARFTATLVRTEANYVRLAAGLAAPVDNVPARRVLQGGFLLAVALALLRRRTEGLRVLAVDAGLFVASVLCLPVLLLWGDLAGLPGWLGGALTLVCFGAFIVMGSARLKLGSHIGLVLAVMAGVVVTLPLIGLDTTRALAATAPLMALPLALAVAVFTGGGGVAPEPGPEPSGPRWSPAVLGATLVVVALVGAPLAAAVVDKPRVVDRTCADGSRAQALLGASWVRIVGDKAAADSVDAIDVESATRDLETGLGLDVIKDLVRPGTTIAAGQNQRGGDRIVFLTGPAEESGGVLYFCGGNLGDHTSVAFSRFWPRPVDFAFMTGTPLAP